MAREHISFNRKHFNRAIILIQYTISRLLFLQEVSDSALHIMGFLPNCRIFIEMKYYAKCSTNSFHNDITLYGWMALKANNSLNCKAIHIEGFCVRPKAYNAFHGNLIKDCEVIFIKTITQRYEKFVIPHCAHVCICM